MIFLNVGDVKLDPVQPRVLRATWFEAEFDAKAVVALRVAFSGTESQVTQVTMPEPIAVAGTEDVQYQVLFGTRSKDDGARAGFARLIVLGKLSEAPSFELRWIDHAELPGRLAGEQLDALPFRIRSGGTQITGIDDRPSPRPLRFGEWQGISE